MLELNNDVARNFEILLNNFIKTQTFNGNDKLDSIVDEDVFWRIKTPTGSVTPNNPFICIQILTQIETVEGGTTRYYWKEFGTFSSIKSSTVNNIEHIVIGGQNRNNYFQSFSLEDGGGLYNVTLNLKDESFEELEDALIRSAITSKLAVEEKISKNREFYDFDKDGKIDSLERLFISNPDLFNEENQSALQEEINKILASADSGDELREQLSTEKKRQEFYNNVKEQRERQKNLGIFNFSTVDTDFVSLRIQFGYFAPATSGNIFTATESIPYANRVNVENKDKIVLTSPVIDLMMMNRDFQVTQSGVNVTIKAISIGKGSLDKARLVQKNAVVKGTAQQLWWDLGKALAVATNERIVFLGTKDFGGENKFINFNTETGKKIQKSGNGYTDISVNGITLVSDNIAKAFTRNLSEIGHALEGQTISFKRKPVTGSTTGETTPDDAIRRFTSAVSNVGKFTPTANTGGLGQITGTASSAESTGYKIEIEVKTGTNAATTVSITDDVTNEINIVRKIQLKLGGEADFEITPGKVKEIVKYKTLKELLNEFCANAPKKFRAKNLGTDGKEVILEEYEVEAQLEDRARDADVQRIINNNYEVIPLQWQAIEKKDSNNISRIFIRFFYPEKKILKQPFIRLYNWRRSKTSIIKSFNITSNTDWANLESNIMTVKNNGGLTNWQNLNQKFDTSSSALIPTERNPNSISLVNYVFDGTDVNDIIQNITANLNKTLAKGSIEIPGDPFFLFDEKMGPVDYSIALNVFRNRNIAKKDSEGKEVISVERSYLSGFYLVTKIVHNISNSGYSTNLELLKYYPTLNIDREVPQASAPPQPGS